MNARPKLGLFVLLALLAAVATACRPVVFFPEFVVNTSEPGENQTNDAAIGPDGDFLVAWTEGSGGADVLVRRFDADTSPLSGALPVNLNTPPATDSSIARDAEGRFVVVWEEGTPLDHIRGRRFAPDGTPLGDDFQISTSTLNAYDPFVGSDPSGNFVVTWTSGGDGVARRFDSHGVPLGGEFPVNAFTPGFQRMSGIAMSATGFVVTWLGPGTGGDGIFGRRFDQDGVPTTGFQVNTAELSPYTERPDVAMNANGDFVVVWSDTIPNYTAFGRRYDSAGAPLGSVFHVSTDTTRYVLNPKVASDTAGNFLVTWSSFPVPHNGRIDVHARFFNFDGSSASGELQVNEFTTALHLYPQPALADDGSFVVAFRNENADVLKARKSGARASHEIVMDPQPTLAASGEAAVGNGVFEPGETQTIETAWANDTDADVDDLVATAELFTGPPGADYTVEHDVAGYPTIPAGQSKSCVETGECFSVTVSDPAERPDRHWDAWLQEETNMGTPHTWVLHLGESFPDVPTDNIFYRFIETLFHKGVTTGCAGNINYCPTSPVTRAQMAVFLLKSKFGQFHVPPPCTGAVFADVPCTGGPFDPWIEELAVLNITGGCSGGNYCPNNTVTRQQMAVFLLKAFEGSSYDPPDCAGAFDDVPCTPGTGFSDWIEELADRGITGGCSVTPPLYCPTNPNNRGQMAVFLTKTFGLILYGG